MQFNGKNTAYRIVRSADQGGAYYGSRKRGAPFWMPASNFYTMSVAAALGVFALAYGLSQDGSSELPWFWACVAGVVTISGAVLLREVVLRSIRDRFIAAQRQLDANMRGLDAVIGASANRPQKITIERNAEMIAKIHEKSDAAKVFGGIAQGHREVFDLCEEYLAAIKNEMPNVGIGSPRIAAFRRGSRLAKATHRFHLLKWAEIESKLLTRIATNHAKIPDKLAAARKALGVVDLALKYYPDESDLRESEEVLRNLVDSLLIAGMVEKAEKAAARNNTELAVKFYQEAIGMLNRNDNGDPEKADAAIRIRSEIKQLKGRKNMN